MKQSSLQAHLTREKQRQIFCWNSLMNYRCMLPLCKEQVRQCPEEIANAPHAFLKRFWAGVWGYEDLKKLGEAYQGCDSKELHKFLAAKSFSTQGIYGNINGIPEFPPDGGYWPSRPEQKCQNVYQRYDLYMWHQSWLRLYWREESYFWISVNQNDALAFIHVPRRPRLL